MSLSVVPDEEVQVPSELPTPPARILSFDDIITADDLEVREIYIPAWKGSVRLRVLTAREAIDFQKKMRDPAKKHESWVEIFALCAVDANNQRMFSDRAIPMLQKKSTAAIMSVQQQLLEMNGFKQPQKTWETVSKILTDSGVESDVIARVERKWADDDEAPAKNV